MLKPGDTLTMSVDAEVAAEVDVLVAGGGTAGCLAALASARNGARTMLVERYGCLGGMMTAGNAGLTMYMKFSGRQEQHAEDRHRKDSGRKGWQEGPRGVRRKPDQNPLRLSQKDRRVSIAAQGGADHKSPVNQVEGEYDEKR